MILLWIPAACAMLGLVVGRWRVLIVPGVVWSGLAVFLVLNNGFYGHGWGEFGVAWSVLVAGMTFAATAVGVGIRLALRRAANARRRPARLATRERSS